MSVEQVDPGKSMVWNSAKDLNWNAIYADQLPRVYNYFRFRLGRHTDIEDLTSRTFEKAWRARAAYSNDLAAFSTWLFKIAQNVGTDYLRSERSYVPLAEVPEIAAVGTPQEVAEQDSDLAKLGRLTAQLTERERELIALRYGGDINNRLIAKLTGLSESNVGVILHRAVQTLKAQW
jgi:RNA polymerase sigma-70 factor (ECF subfamily)